MNDLLISKAKRIDTGEWVEGYIIECDRSDSGYCIWRKIENEYHMTDIVVESICRSTGLRDRNNELIFENDILSDGYKQRKVVWNNLNNHAPGWYTEWEDGVTTHSNWWSNLEIIGSAIDTPELLKEG